MAAPQSKRTRPNIVVTGTPGTGKTTHCEAVVASVGGQAAGLRHVSINELVRDRDCHDGWDAEYQSWLVDEDRLLDALEADDVPHGRGAGVLLDWHACDLFPTGWIDLVVVLTADTTSLYDRLAERKYPEKKMQENIDAEIMQVLLQEAHEAFPPEMVVTLQSNTVEDMESNVDRIVAWAQQWYKDNDLPLPSSKSEQKA
ncbi:hemoglobin and proliferation regulated protein [Grosmannia clavigera kw1407]|uniref:Adenylate kinase isoenzyme 6 homolog n=1 Tax=Grosmannia clavigera (strain kw1407 / UAMH 11150) TaxID=655863 RepID=F0XM30_GROCL|nr:hemoglobin and proliferation regulated protein [Grosmannia clavigera kw1407]EFX01114.1 hemoglobin and proliferation regulated protein [Grosmannia clavigera kw1407]